MKTPEEIKKALRKCIGWNSGYSCGECPFWYRRAICKAELCHEAIEYMEQLETRTSLKPCETRSTMSRWRTGCGKKRTIPYSASLKNIKNLKCIICVVHRIKMK